MARILIVDDDPDVVEATKLCLEGAGHQVSSAFNREDGMKHVKSDDPDLLVLDVMMSESDDGIVMAQDLRRDGFTKPILMMSSIGKVTGLQYGRDDEVTPVDEFAEKPVKPADLVAKVAKLLKGN